MKIGSVDCDILSGSKTPSILVMSTEAKESNAPI
jgi:hypothetical protein